MGRKPCGDARALIWSAFAVVSLGALGAVFRYEVVAIYRAPVMLAAAVGGGGLARAYYLSRQRQTKAAQYAAGDCRLLADLAQLPNPFSAWSLTVKEHS